MHSIYPKFSVIKETANGRLGVIETAHGTIETPAFVFCATKGAMKAYWPHMLRPANTQMILSNTYHLIVNSDSELIDSLGGLQKMTNWHGPMMTDSGGYQIFSLGYGSVSQEIKGTRQLNRKALVKVDDNGARFRSYKNGSELYITPEKSVQAQIDFGADLIFVLDECTAYNISKDETEKSMMRSHDWERRSVEYFSQHRKSHQGIYSIVQGGVYPEFRKRSVDFVNSLDTFGIGIGGSLGRNLDDMRQVLSYVSGLKLERPRHLLGIGTIDSIFAAMPFGIDTFDCVYPTRLARHGGALIRGEKNYLNLNNAYYVNDEAPISKNCKCCTCASFSRAYLHMLLKSKEILAIMALTEHNIVFMNNLMSYIRSAIKNDAWEEFKKEWQKGEK